MSETADKPLPWYAELPAWSKTLLQMGFAGVFIAYVFIANREDRSFFREQLEAERVTFREAIKELNKAIDALEENQRLLKAALEDRPIRAMAPPPKLKPTP